MPQVFTNFLNDAIEDVAFDPFAVGPFDSLSVRLEKMQSGTYTEINGIDWGSLLALTIPTANVFGSLLIIRNHIFDPNLAYGNSVVSSFLDVVYKDNLSRLKSKRSFDFKAPLKLEGAADYLIVAAGFTDPDIIPPTTMFTYLSVRGRTINPNTINTNLVPR